MQKRSGSGRGELAGGSAVKSEPSPHEESTLEHYRGDGASGGGAAHSHFEEMFTSFGEHARMLQLLPDVYASHGLLGAVVQNMRGAGFYAAAVWDGRRIHTLEGFASPQEAEASARDIIAMIAAIHVGGSEALAALPLLADPRALTEQRAANGQAPPPHVVAPWPDDKAGGAGAGLASPLSMHLQSHRGHAPYGAPMPVRPGHHPECAIRSAKVLLEGRSSLLRTCATSIALPKSAQPSPLSHCTQSLFNR